MGKLALSQDSGQSIKRRTRKSAVIKLTQTQSAALPHDRMRRGSTCKRALMETMKASGVSYSSREPQTENTFAQDLI